MYRTQEESLAAARAMTSEERIEALSHGIVDNDILTVEIEHRTGIPQAVAEVVIVFEILHGYEGGVLDLVALATEIGLCTKAPEPETEGIEDVDAETALKVLLAQDDIYWDCGLNYFPEDD